MIPNFQISLTHGGKSIQTCEKFFPIKASRHLAPHSICAEEKRPLRCSVRHTTAAWRRTRQHAQGELGRAQGREDRHLRHGKRRSYARARAPARRARVAKEEPETVAENAPLGIASAAPGITRPCNPGSQTCASGGTSRYTGQLGRALGPDRCSPAWSDLEPGRWCWTTRPARAARPWRSSSRSFLCRSARTAARPQHPARPATPAARHPEPECAA